MEQKKQAGKHERASKTSKTAHVLNLLSGTQPPSDTPGTPPQIPGKRPTAAPSDGPSLPVLEIAKNNNQQLSESIHTALENALEQELLVDAAEKSAQAASASGQEAHMAQRTPVPSSPALEAPSEAPFVQVSGPSDRDAPSLCDPVSGSDAQEAEVPPPSHDDPPACAAPPVRTAVTSGAGPAPLSCVSEVELPDGSVFLNVTAILAEEFFQRYSAPAGLCPCPRCQADARALALSRLAARYVVLPAAAKSPMLALYRNEFRTDLLTQVLMACQAVQESPRHQTGSAS